MEVQQTLEGEIHLREAALGGRMVAANLGVAAFHLGEWYDTNMAAKLMATLNTINKLIYKENSNRHLKMLSSQELPLSPTMWLRAVPCGERAGSDRHWTSKGCQEATGPQAPLSVAGSSSSLSPACRAALCCV